MNRLIIIVTSLVLLSFSSQAQLFSDHVSIQKINEETNGSLSGKVVDAITQKPLAGATVFIHDVKVGAISKDDGSFSTQEFTAGNYLVEVSYQGYATILANIQITKNTQHNFSLKQSVREQEAVTVTGVASAVRVKSSPQPVSILKRSDLLQTTSNNVIEAISKIVPGVNTLSTGPAISKPVIRGLGYNRVVVVNDGIRQEGQQWGDEHGIEVDEYSIQRIEVLKGPASLMYGSDAMAGVINMISNVPVAASTLKGNIIANYNTNNRLYGVNGNLAGNLQNGFNWNIYSTYKSAGDYKNKYDGYVLNSRFQEQNVGGYAGINKKWGYSHVLVTNVHQRLGIVEGERDVVTGRFLIYPATAFERPATNAELQSRDLITPYQTIDHFKITSDNNISIGKDRINFTAGFQRNQRREYGDPAAIKDADLYFDLRSFNYGLQYHLAENNGWRTAVGLNGMQQSNQNKAGNVLIPEYDLFDIGGFVYTRKQFSDLTLSGGVRLDTRDVNSHKLQQGTALKFDAFKKQFTNVSGSAGISYDASSSLTLKANIARGFRAPNIAELASNGAHEGTNRYEYGDKNLKSETSFQLDAGADISRDHFSLSITGFYNNINNYIYYGKVESVNGGDSIVNVNGDLITAFKFRQQQAVLKGFEINLDIHPHPFDWLHFQNSLSFVRGNFSTAIEGDNDLPFMPATKLRSDLRFDLKGMNAALKNTYLSLEMDKTFAQNKVFSTYNTETPTDDYTIFNFALGTDFVSHDKTLFSLHFAFNNIFDVAYQNHLSRLKYAADNNATGRQGVYNTGRNFNFKLNVPLDFKL